MKVMTILGTRPEIIRLSLIIKWLDQYSQQLLVHTGQNYEECLSKIFFEDLDLREPDIYLGIKGNSFADQVGQILLRSESLFLEHRPDRLLILGDTNSGLSTIAARRLGIPVYHLEAGNRCYDDRVPEEINRRVIDHTSSILMRYTYRSMENLRRGNTPGTDLRNRQSHYGGHRPLSGTDRREPDSFAPQFGRKEILFGHLSPNGEC